MPPITAPRARGRPPKVHAGAPKGGPTTPTPSSAAAIGREKTAGIAEVAGVVGWERPQPALQEATVPVWGPKETASHLPTGVGKGPCADHHCAPFFDGTPTTIWGTIQVLSHPVLVMHRRKEDPQIAVPPEDPRAEDHLQGYPQNHHQRTTWRTPTWRTPGRTTGG